MLSPADVSLAPLPTPLDALRSIAAVHLAVSVPRACSRNRKSRPHRSPINAVSNFASTDAKQAHLPLERKGSATGSRELAAQRLSPKLLSLQSRSGILDLPGPRRRSRYLPEDSEKRLLLKLYP